MQENEKKKTVDYTDDYPKFTPEMKGTYTILVPDMLPYHFDIIKHIVGRRGYRMEVLKNDSRAVIDEGLKHVHNDTCYPALCVIGQYLDALKSGKYDVNHTAVMITQSGGGCRASNYIPLIRKALKAEFPQVPVMSLNFSGLEKGNGIEIDLSLLLQLAFGIFYGDTLMTLYNQCKPYEKNIGDTDRAREECFAEIKKSFDSKAYKKYKKIIRRLIERFSQIDRTDEEKVKVGIVGEIYVKYSPLGNSHLEEFLLSEGCEPVVPALMDFVLYCIVNNINDTKLYGRTKKTGFIYSLVYKYAYHIQKQIIKIFVEDGTFEPPHDFQHLRQRRHFGGNQPAFPHLYALIDNLIGTAVRLSAQSHCGKRRGAGLEKSLSGRKYRPHRLRPVRYPRQSGKPHKIDVGHRAGKFEKSQGKALKKIQHV